MIAALGLQPSDNWGMVAALAGRRIDAAGARDKRFPPENVEVVKGRIHQALKDGNARVLVCAAACGADILALEAAGELDIIRFVLLPGTRESFRKGSVVDRGEEWGPRYDRVIGEVQDSGRLYEMPELDRKYMEANGALLRLAETAAAERGERVTAFVVWNGVARKETDVTEDFLLTAKSQGLEIREISTL